MQGIRKNYLTVYGDGTIVPDNDTIGYIGEHLATELVFTLPDNLLEGSYVYSLNFEDENGNTSVGTMLKSTLTFVVPQSLTETNSLKLQLLITDNGKVIFNSSVITLKLHSSVELTPQTESRYEGLLEDTLSKFNSLMEQLGGEDLSKIKGVIKIEKTSSTGLTDVYTVTYTDNTTSRFIITNGKDGSDYVLTDDDKQEIARLIGTQTVKTALDAELKANTEYYIGTQTAVKLVYPQSGNAGDSIYVNFTGASSGTRLTAKNCVGLADFQPQSGYVCEIHAQYDGSRWVCLTAQTETAV